MDKRWIDYNKVRAAFPRSHIGFTVSDKEIYYALGTEAALRTLNAMVDNFLHKDVVDHIPLISDHYQLELPMDDDDSIATIMFRTGVSNVIQYMLDNL